jgi:hypothetical protein
MVWHTAPAMVKMRRPGVADATADRRAGQALAHAVSLLHEMGTLVVMEGLQTEMEALTAIDADADFATGSCFGPPIEDLGSYSEPGPVLDVLWNTYKKHVRGRTRETAARASLAGNPQYSSEVRKLQNASPAEISRYREERSSAPRPR